MPTLRTAPSRSSGGRLRHLWADRLDPESYLGLHLTVSLAGIALAVWVFSALLDAVLDNDIVVRWDAAADLAIHEHMTPPSLRLVDAVTQLGSPVAMMLLGLAVAVILWRRSQRTVCWGWIAAFVGGGVLGVSCSASTTRRTSSAAGRSGSRGWACASRQWESRNTGTRIGCIPPGPRRLAMRAAILLPQSDSA